jgi:TolB-like protein/tetratricopeptide (TPR) repeat protein
MRGSRILVVARELALRTRLARLLIGAGHRLELAESPEHACRFDGFKDFDLAVVASDGLGAEGSALIAELQAGAKRLLLVGQAVPPGVAADVLDPADEIAVLAWVTTAARQTVADAELPELEPILRFAGYELDLNGHSLARGSGAPIALTRGEFALMREFVQRPGRVLPRDYLLGALAGRDAETFDRSIDMLVSRLRKKIELDPKRPSLIVTVPGAGYKFAARVEHSQPVEGVASAQAPLARVPIAAPYAAPSSAHMVMRRSPTLAVLPFANLSHDPQQNYFAAGLTEELITALSRVRWFSVVTRPSTRPFQNQASNVPESAPPGGVHYLLEGSAQRGNGRIRITCQLIDAETGHHTWAQRFDGELDDVFGLQEKVAAAIVGAVEPNLERAEVERVRAKPTANLDAYDLYLRALEPFFSMTREGCAEALALARRAAALDPDFALAHAHTVACLTRRVALGWGGPGDREEGTALARKVFATNGADPLPLVCVVFALGDLAADWAAALDAANRALALNPNSALVQLAAGWANNWACNADAAVEHFIRAIELDPLSRDAASMLAGLARAHLMANRPEEALALAERAEREMPACASAHRMIIAALWRLGRQGHAVIAAERFRAACPHAAKVSAEGFLKLYRHQYIVEPMIKAWREAGLPE